MRLRFFFTSAIFLFFGLVSQAQVYEVLYQGFEDGETMRCHWTPANGVSTSTTVFRGGSHSLHLLQQTDNEVELYLDTLDFTQNTSLHYLSLFFDHICHVPKNSSSDYFMAMLYYKRVGQTTWTAMSGQDYNQTEEHSTQFNGTGAFNDRSYPEWYTNEAANASMWKSERFDLNQVLASSVAASERLVQIKFVLRRSTLGGTIDTNVVGWWIDNIKVRASAEPMMAPRISMVTYPESYYLPSSRGARIELDATTAISSGINPDSVYLFYKVGSDTTAYRLPMSPLSGGYNRFGCRIPYYGYDTLMQFYCVVRDATSNANMAKFPKTDDTWIRYVCVRGVSQPGLQTPEFTGTNHTNLFPFPAVADHRCEVVYDSALMASAGYGPGAITQLRYMLGANTEVQTLQRFQIKMLNVGTDYTANTAAMEPPFYSDYMHVVYDGTYSIGALSAGIPQTIQFQDTFYYAGKDILMQMTFDCSYDVPGIDINMINGTTPKSTIYYWGGGSDMGYHPFAGDLEKASLNTTLRPAFVFFQHPNMPLLYDAGISELVDPNFTTPMTQRPGSLTVKLKNYGALSFDSVRISYIIDDTLSGWYDWTGMLNGSDNLNQGQETQVVISSNINIPAGYHTLKVWVEDTLKSSGVRYRDHEPYNDTAYSTFIVCDGPMGGVRNIGGANAHFNTIDEFLLSLSRCGMNDSLIVRLAPGCYPPFTMPEVSGLTEQQYLVFESMNVGQPAILYSDSSIDASTIVNLEQVANVSMRNLKFVRREGAMLTDMVTLGVGSTNCRLEGCTFVDSMDNPAAAMRIASMVNSGYANNMSVDGCTFIGARVGVDVKGQAADIRSNNNRVSNSLFRNQNEYAVKVENQENVTIEGNEMYDVTGNSGYVLQLSECYGATTVQRNKVYTSHGAGAVGVSNVIGTAAQHALLANNMVVCADDGSANQMRTTFNIIQADYLDVVYNSVKMNAPTRAGVAAATFGGGVLSNSRFVNNIVVTLDATNYALSYQPLANTTNTVHHNDYYTAGAVMNKKGSSSYGTLAAWQVAVPEDSLSISVNPNFLNGGLVDLRTYNRQIKGLALPMTEVSEDFFGTVRDSVAPCLGAFEFLSLDYDFEPEVLLNPLAEDCYMPNQTELVLMLRNSGVNTYTPGAGQTLQIGCQVNGGEVSTVNVNQSVPAEDTVTIHTGIMLHLPANGIEDSTYTLRVWNTFPTDPNQTNDTHSFTVISRYHPAAPANATVTTSYATSAVVTPTAGIDTWSVYNSSSAPLRQSQISWYNNPTDTEPFYVGPSYTTEELFMDREYYIRQRRSMPIVRITQVEILRSNATVGLTSPMPYWMENSRKAAVQLTNIGDGTAYLEGDTLMTISTATNLNNKVYVFGNVKIEPGQSLVVQYVGNGVTDSSVTLRNPSLGSANVAYNANIAFVYKRAGVVEDVVPFNAVISTTTSPWNNMNVPTYVWSGDAITFPNNTAGVMRTAFDGNLSDWTFSSATNPMFLGSNRSEWIRYIDRGCEGEPATITVSVLGRPAVDLSVGRPVLSAEGCGLSEEEVSATITNFGTSTVSSFQINYSAGGTPVMETVTTPLASDDSMTYTFATPLNLLFSNDTSVTVRVWVTAHASDTRHVNDTNQTEVVSLYTPAQPDTIAVRQVPYATADTISLPATETMVPVWYNYEMNPVDTGSTHITDILYYGGTMGVSYLAVYGQNAIVGTGILTNNKTAYPSPYQPNNAYAKQQYIYSASELTAAGLTAGNIYSIAFFLDSIYANRESVVFDDYRIALGLTTDTIFSSTSAWKPVQQVFHRQTMPVYRAWDKQWVSHDLDTAFYWDGTSSLVVQVTHELPAPITTGLQTRYTSKTNTTLHKAQNNASLLEFTGAGTRGANRPNLKFNKRFGCTSTIRPYQVHVTNVPPVDAALTWPAGSDTIVYNNCDSIVPMVNVRNQGDSLLTDMKLYYWLDNMSVDSTMVTTSLSSGQLGSMPLFSRMLTPGRHALTVVVSAVGDEVASNDTLYGNFLVRFCPGLYTISLTDSNADYHDFGTPVDTLNIAGIEGPVTFLVDPGIYQEQVVIGDIFGTSAVNTITFQGVNDSVILRGINTQANNYVLQLNGASHLRINNIVVEARPASGNYGHALVIQDATDLRITDSRFRVKSSIADKNASCLIINGIVNGLTLSGNIMDSGFYSVYANDATGSYSNILITDNAFNEFASGGVYLRGVSNVSVNGNEILSGNSANNRGLIGVLLSTVTDSLSVQKNKIYLIDNKQGAKRGIVLENAVCSVLNPGFVVNNMISTNGTDSKSLFNINGKSASAGIVVDSSSSYLNILYNSVRVYGTTSTALSKNDLTYAFYCGNTPTNLMVYNNIFANLSYGYAYFVGTSTAVSTSNFNAYYTEATYPFSWNGVTRASLAALQVGNSDDANSLFSEPYFAAVDDLHLLMTNFVDKAQYTTDVTEDIDGDIRPQIPAPTIGADEMERLTHDMAVVRIYKPVMPLNINNPQNIESDSVLVSASFYNNGRSNETGVTWYAYIDGYETQTRSQTRSLGNFVPAQMKTDSVMVPAILGIIDTQLIRVVVVDSYDTSLSNNELTSTFYLAPAYNLKAVSIDVVNPITPAGCSMQRSQIKLGLKNEGFKDFPAGTPLTIGYHAEVSNPTNLSISTIPDTVIQEDTLDNILPKNSTVYIFFDSLANLYPTGYAQNIKVKVNGWCHYAYDIVPANDTTNKVQKDSYYTPAPPFGHDTTLAYGVWGRVQADQENSRPIRWYRDSTAAPFYSPNNYNTSRWWNTTPQYYHDTTYYLNCLSDKNCPSAFSLVTVSVAERIPNDMAVEDVFAPLGSRVYMEDDTVRLKVANYGTQSQSNIPIHYELKRGNTVIQEVDEVVPGPIAAGQTTIFTFNELLHLTTPTTNQNYSLMIWTDLANDGTRRNDTLRYAHTFNSKAEATYTHTTPNTGLFDVTRFSFNQIDIDMPPLGRGYTNLASYESPDYPVCHLTHGTGDSLLIQVTPLDATAQVDRCKVWVFIDFDRSGTFSTNEYLVNGDVFYDNMTYSTFISIPQSASYGYMRMRVVVGAYSDFNGGEAPVNGIPENLHGHTLDFMLFVDKESPMTDLAIAQMVSPRSSLIRKESNQVTEASPRIISFRMLNRGSQPITSVDIHYQFVADTADSANVNTFQWTGNLMPGTSTVVTLPEAHVFPEGTSTLTIWHSLPGDQMSSNNTLVYEYHRFHVVTLVLDDDFEGEDLWYAPRGYNLYSRNFWQRGVPNKIRIDTAFSGVNVWVTDTTQTIATGTRGSVSYLYSPVIDQSQIRADTLSLRLRRNLVSGSSMHIEYYNFEGKWVNMSTDSVLTWYNNTDDQVFDGTSSNSESYVLYYVPGSLFSGEYSENLQFRIVYTTPLSSNQNATFGEGCAVDNFHVGRAKIKIDAGVVDIPYPTEPKYGETIYPKVVVHNYGYDTIRQLQIGYIHYGTYLAKINDVLLHLAPGEDTLLAFTAPFVVTSDFPDTFQISAFTIHTEDNYFDNDTNTRKFGLAPLNNDISAEEILAPLQYVIAGDTAVQLTLRLRNFGVNPIEHAEVSYLVNGLNRVDEQINFNALLGRPLRSMEYFNYTFRTKFRAAMGLMRLTAITNCDTNEYIYNDTVVKKVEGITSVNDLAAVAMVVDTTTGYGNARLCLMIENRGARGANNFEVGFWIDNDTSTIVRETYWHDLPIPALTTGFHYFDTVLPSRSLPYDRFTSFVHINGDNDPSNDTTVLLAERYVDLEALKVVVEENASNECRVFMKIRNIGNMTVTGQTLRLQATINGTDISYNLTRRIDPGEQVSIELNRTIPKSPTRQYEGTGSFSVRADTITANNQTSIVEVQNYVEGIPSVNAGKLVLEQNYPNPFTHQTTIPFSLPEASQVRFFVMDAMGHIVHRFERFYQAGDHSFTIDMDAYASGIYFYGIEVNGQRQMRKMILK